MSRPAPLAALRAGPDAGDLLAGFARDVTAQGYRVRGLLQRTRVRPDGSLDRVVEDLVSGRCFDINQNLGPGSASCNIDPRGLADASIVLRQAIEDRADLVVVSRFGKLEAANRGLAAEMLAVMAAGVPLLTIIGETCIPAWTAMTGGLGLVLDPDRDRLGRWWRDVTPPR